MLKGHVFENQLFGNPIFAVFVNTFLASENGVINGFGNGMAVTTNGFNLTVQSGVCCVQGRFLQEDTSTTITAGSTPAYARLVIEIDLDKVNTENDFQQGYYKVITNSGSYPNLTQTDIVNNVSGVYQFPLGRFQITSNGIVNYADERAYLDFNSIYEEIRDIIQGIEDGSEYVLQSTFINSKGKIVYDNESNNNNDITLDEDISEYDTIEVFYKVNRQVVDTFRDIYGSTKVINPVGKCFNADILVLGNVQGKNQRGATGTFLVSATGITNIGGSFYELTQTNNYPYIMGTANHITITRVVAYKRSHYYEEE